MTEAKTFDDIDDFKMTDLEGDSKQVLTDAWMMDTGAALTESDLFTAGFYPIAHEPGMYSIFVKKVNNNLMEVRTIVEDWAIDHAKKELQEEKDLAKRLLEINPNEEEICKHCVPAWIRTEIMFKHNINPEFEPERYEQVLWQEYPELWVDERKAPKLN